MTAARTPEAERLISLAADHMIAHGVSGVSLSGLAKSIGSNNRMLLYYFGSKDRLFTDALAVAYARFPDLRDLASLLDRGGPLTEVLGAAWRAVRAETNLPYARLFFESFGAAARAPDENRSQLDALSTEWPVALTRLLERHGRTSDAAARGALQVLALWRGLQFSWLEGVAPADLDRAHDDAIEALLG